MPSLLLATGMLGATVMPHVICLHGALTTAMRATPRRNVWVWLRSQRVDVISAMGAAGVLNVIMLVVAARVLSQGPEPVTTIEAAHSGLNAALGPTAAVLFAVALLASSFAAVGVGTLAGQVVMQGFLRRTIPLALRRLVTLAPAVAVIASGLDVTRALVLSQVILSFVIPVALFPSSCSPVAAS